MNAQDKELALRIWRDIQENGYEGDHPAELEFAHRYHTAKLEQEAAEVVALRGDLNLLAVAIGAVAHTTNHILDEYSALSPIAVEVIEEVLPVVKRVTGADVGITLQHNQQTEHVFALREEVERLKTESNGWQQKYLNEHDRSTGIICQLDCIRSWLLGEEVDGEKLNAAIPEGVNGHKTLVQLLAAQAEAKKLREALEVLLNHYVRLVESGDAGSWDADTETEVIGAKQALSTYQVTTEGGDCA